MKFIWWRSDEVPEPMSEQDESNGSKSVEVVRRLETVTDRLEVTAKRIEDEIEKKELY